MGQASAGVGAGYDDRGESTLGSLVIRHGRFMVSGEVGIGSTVWGTTSRIEIDGTARDWIQLDCWSDTLWCMNGSYIVARNAWLDFTTNTPTFVEPIQNARTDFGTMNLVGRYRVPSTKDSFGTDIVLHFGTVEHLGRDDYSLQIHQIGTEYWRVFAFNASETVGLIASLAYEGKYTAHLYDMETDKQSDLCNKGLNDPYFQVGFGETFYQHVAPCGSAKPSSSGSGLTKGQQAGIAIGVILFVVIVAAVVWLLVIKGFGSVIREKFFRPVPIEEVAEAAAYTEVAE
jgi:hypothetical protein